MLDVLPAMPIQSPTPPGISQDAGIVIDRSPLELTGDFRKTFGLPSPKDPVMPPKEVRHHYHRLFMEELGYEYAQACEAEDLQRLADSLVDGAFVLYHAICRFGLQSRFQALFEEVNRSNLTKNPPSTSEDHAKFERGPNYTPPNLQPILALDSNQ